MSLTGKWKGDGDKSKKVRGRALFERLFASREGLEQADPAAPLVGSIVDAEHNVVRTCPYNAFGLLVLYYMCRDAIAQTAFLQCVAQYYGMTLANLKAQKKGSYKLDHDRAAAREVQRCLRANAQVDGNDWVDLPNRGNPLRNQIIAAMQTMSKLGLLGQLPSLVTSITITYPLLPKNAKLSKFTQALVQTARSAGDETLGSFGRQHRGGEARSSRGLYDDFYVRADRLPDVDDVGGDVLSHSPPGFAAAALPALGGRYRQHHCHLCHKDYVCPVAFDDRSDPPALKAGYHYCPATGAVEACFRGYWCPSIEVCRATTEKRQLGGSTVEEARRAYAPVEDRRDFEKMTAVTVQFNKEKKKGHTWILHLCRCGVYFPQPASAKRPQHCCRPAKPAESIKAITAKCPTGCKGECVPNA